MRAINERDMSEVPDFPITQREAILDMLTLHAEDVLRQSHTNRFYAARVLRNVEEVRDVFTDGIGEVDGVVTTWFTSFKPIAEAVFGVVLGGEPMAVPEQFKDYSPTVFPDVYGRVRRVSLDEIMGPMLALDLMAMKNIAD